MTSSTFSSGRRVWTLEGRQAPACWPEWGECVWCGPSTNQTPVVKDILHDLNHGVFNHRAQKMNESDT